MGKIKKYSIGLLVSKSISILLVIFFFNELFFYSHSLKTGVTNKNMIIFGIIYSILSLINTILNVIFFELLSQNISDSNF